MIAPRLSADMRIGALKRQTEALGGFATVLKKGDPVSGSILVQTLEKGCNPKLFEQMPNLDGASDWHCIWSQDTERKGDIQEYLDRRTSRDRDLWIIELDIADSERLGGLLRSVS